MSERACVRVTGIGFMYPLALAEVDGVHILGLQREWGGAPNEKKRGATQSL